MTPSTAGFIALGVIVFTIVTICVVFYIKEKRKEKEESD